MKNIFLMSIILISSLITLNAQTWQWSNSAGGVGKDAGYLVCQDSNGYTYVSGGLNYFNFNPDTVYFKTDTLTINGINDFFIAKYDASGTEIWVKQFGGSNTNTVNPSFEGISDLIYDSFSNSIYITGDFTGSCSFDSITLTSCGGTEIFFTRFDLAGNCIWAKKSCGVTDDSGGKIVSDKNGNLYLTGILRTAGTFDSLALQNGQFLAKYDVNGNIYWIKKISNIQFSGIPQYPISTFIFNSNNLYMYGTSFVDDLTIDTMTFAATNYYGVILTRWDVDGNILWGKRFGGPVFLYGDLGIDSYGNYYMTGTYNATSGNYAVFDNDTVYSSGIYSGFLAKFNSSGNKVWVKEINSSQYIDVIQIHADNDGNSYLTSSFADTIFFGTSFIKAGSNEDAFVARYDSAGSLLNTISFGEGHGYDIIGDTSGAFFITGYFAGNFNLGNSLSSNGSYDMFIAKHDAITSTGHGGFRTVNDNLIIYANPNKGTCTIIVPDEFHNEKNLILQIYDNAGKLLQQSKIEIQQDKIKVNIQAEARGVYPVVLTNGKKSYSGKIVFE